MENCGNIHHELLSFERHRRYFGVDSNRFPLDDDLHWIEYAIRTVLVIDNTPYNCDGVGQVLQALSVFVSSYIPGFWLFILFYGILFGLIARNSLVVPIGECNKYLVGKKMIVNNIILMGTGLGSVVFSMFSYSFLNPKKYFSSERVL